VLGFVENKVAEVKLIQHKDFFSMDAKVLSLVRVIGAFSDGAIGREARQADWYLVCISKQIFLNPFKLMMIITKLSLM